MPESDIPNDQSCSQVLFTVKKQYGCEGVFTIETFQTQALNINIQDGAQVTLRVAGKHLKVDSYHDITVVTTEDGSNRYELEVNFDEIPTSVMQALAAFTLATIDEWRPIK
jgi:hypothetical protein